MDVRLTGPSPSPSGGRAAPHDSAAYPHGLTLSLGEQALPLALQPSPSPYLYPYPYPQP